MVAVHLIRRAFTGLAVALAMSSATAQTQLLPPLDLSARQITFKLQPKPRAQRGAIHVTMKAGERPRDVARAYGVPASSLGVDPNKPQPAGAVLRVPITADTPERRLPPGVFVHRVRSGETLESISRAHNLHTVDLVSANLDQQSLDELAVGEELLIPGVRRGLVVRVKPGQDVTSVAQYYGADIADVARANALNSPTEIAVGDYLLLPGLVANGHMQELRARRERAAENARKRERLERYERYVAYLKDVERRKLQAKYEAQARYEKYLAWLESPERRAQQAKYEKQAQYEAWLAQQAQQKAQAVVTPSAEHAEHAAGTLRTPTGVIRRASYGGSSVSWPMRGFRLTSRFGERDIEFHRQYFHGGIDLAAPYGSPIYAATDGVVRQSGYGDYGLNVWMQSGNATVIYGHMSRTAVTNGQTVKRGQILGYVGCTGVCTGPHLHFEVRVDGTPVDPIGLLP